MTLKDDLVSEVSSTFKSQWAVEKATVIPDAEDLRLNSNHAKHIESATVLYADLDGSTKMVDSKSWNLAAEVYKSYLRCAAAVIREEGGVISAYDGDRVMGIFAGDSKNTSAVRAALKIHWATKFIVQPALDKQYPSTYTVKHVVGIDTSEMHVARIGVHGDNDLVWVGKAANHAAKLCELSEFPTWITEAVYDKIRDELKYSNSVHMWTARSWTPMGGAKVYCSNYWWQMP